MESSSRNIHIDSHSDSEADVVIINQDELSNYNPDQVLPRPPEVIDTIRKWLNPTPYDLPSGEYRKHLASHMGGTGDWLTSSAANHGWRHNGDHGMLWIQGVPGSGKSVMAAKLAADLKAAHPGCPVLFFFFRQIIKSNHAPEQLLRDWMDQVLEYSPPLQERLETYVKKNQDIAMMSIQDLFADLRLAFARLHGKVFCVADALDEMDQGHDDFLAALGSLGAWRPAQVKVLLTSRPVAKLEIPLRGLPCVRMRLEEADVDHDIAVFVQNTLQTSSIAPDHWEKITGAVPGRANGIFLYAKLAMDAFLEPDANINEVLLHLPTDLNVLYTRLLREHAVRTGVSQHVQNLLLQAVTHASRPLRLLELADLVLHTLPDADARDLGVTKQLLRVACGPLLEVLPDETVSVVHHSLTEYLKGTTRSEEERRDSSYYPVLEPGPCHSRLATACLHYLLSGCLRSVKVTIKDQDQSKFEWSSYYKFNDSNKQLITLALQYPFAKYAVENWHHHIRQSEKAAQAQDQVLPDVAALLQEPAARKAWLQLCWPTSPSSAGNVTPLHIAGHTGLVAYTSKLLESTPVDVLDSQGKTALWWAANSGYAETIRLLVAAGADPDRNEPVYGLKPLHRAAEAGHSAAVVALLDAGVSPFTGKTRENPGMFCGNAPTTTGESPLEYAATNGHVEVVKEMIPYLDQETLQGVLRLAAAASQPKVSSLIIRQPGFDINYASTLIGTPLNRACQCLDLDSVRFLLEAGADPNFVKPESKTHSRDGFADMTFGCSSDRYEAQRPLPCLHILARSNHSHRTHDHDNREIIQEIFALLSHHGVQIDRQDDDGRTALHAAANSAVMTKLLIHAGADANLPDKNGFTPIHLAEHPDVIAILVEEGSADINRVANDGKTPICRFLGFSREAVTLALLKYHPDIRTTDSSGNGALHCHFSSPVVSKMVVAELLQQGVNPNLRNNKGLTPLLSHSNLPRDVLEMLFEAGADVNATDSRGLTPIFYALGGYGSPGNSTIDRITRFVETGASALHRTNRGCTLLHHAVNCATPGSLQTFQAVMDLGIDVHCVDNDKNTLLHTVALSSDNHSTYNADKQCLMLRKLVKIGLSPEQRNHAGRTPLHMLCLQAFRDESPDDAKQLPIDFMIANMKTVNVVDHDGVTPLHMACVMGEVYTKRLLDNGADAAARTREGMSALHLAARSRNSNIVGMLLDALKKQSGQINTHLSTGGAGTLSVEAELARRSAAAWFAEQVNAVPDFQARTNGITPQERYTALHFACRSGISATLGLFLDLGIELRTDGLFAACEAFEEEDKKWKIAQAPAELPLLLEDTCRQNMGKRSGYQSPGTLSNDVEARLDDVAKLMIQHGIDPEKQSPPVYKRYNTSYIEPWDNIALPYAATCIQRALNMHTSAEDTTRCIHSDEVDRLLHKGIAQAAENSIRERKELGQPLWKDDRASLGLVVKLLANRQYHHVELLQSLGADFAAIHQNNRYSVLGLLAYQGFSELLERTGVIEAKRKFVNGGWHAWKDSTRPGLWHGDSAATKNNGEGDQQERPSNQKSLLIWALQRRHPNMACVRILIEKLGVNPDELLHIRHERSRSALLEVASGYVWWHAHQAVPYLIQAGADLEVVNDQGQTPLHVALIAGSRGGLFSKEVAKTLILAGANTHAKTKEGKSCLALVGRDVELLGILMERGAPIEPAVLIAAIKAGEENVVKVLLERGADPNLRPAPHEEPDPSAGGFRPVPDDGIDPSQRFALHYAGMRLERVEAKSAANRIVQLLLKYGADPMGKFLEQTDIIRQVQEEPDRALASLKAEMDTADKLQAIYVDVPEVPSISVPKCHSERTVLHSLIYSSRPIEEFLEVPGLDIEHKDAYGKTLLLAVCGNNLNGELSGNYTTRTLHALVSMGANLNAADNAGRNAVHHLSRRHGAPAAARIAALERIVKLAPNLVNARDIGGCTPLHLALSNYRVVHGGTDTIDKLLELGADAAAVTKGGDTVLHILAPLCGQDRGRELFARFLALSKKPRHRHADIDARNDRGETALFHWIVGGGLIRADIRLIRRFRGESFAERITRGIEFFQGLGADSCARDAQGRSLLHRAAGGNVTLFEALMGLGLDPFWEDKRQQTALDVAAAKENRAILKLFEKK
ncbi:hypothetical protein PWT90_09629 [Aphanocladium album]|nr:hypothetical protein PWT90_09629 [Aphanocladium album]